MESIYNPNMIQSPKGTKDLLPDGSPGLDTVFSSRHHQYIIEQAGLCLERAGAKLIQTPLFEYSEVIERGVGGSTDIVQKEMFSVSNRRSLEGEGTRGFILRPEGTAPIARAYIQNGLKQFPVPLKLWTTGPMFRAENVQEGRYRQFHQIAYEVFGSSEALVDAESVALMWTVLDTLGLRDIELKLGSVGDREDRMRYNAYLKETFLPHLEDLSDESKVRLEINPMRILDSKDLRDQKVTLSLVPKMMLDMLGEASKTHFEEVKTYLDALGIVYTIDPTIVRGLDYYSRTAWEIHHRTVGGKSALGGGGRYDGLIETLGGAPTPGIGWAFGIERIIKALQTEKIQIPERAGPLVYFGSMDESGILYVAKLAKAVRTFAGAEFGYKSKGAGKHIADALKKDARFVALVGSHEIETEQVTVKELVSGNQWTLTQDLFLQMMQEKSLEVPEESK